ncbi:sulfite exporter TauE/SafE family protein [Shewanella metallivivens]|uniref:Probable membrane transporter protein n=1 Tax=Shewanella metallivivens TaxID=2872342 RepID=A0ABT5TNF6_9GAMM|nr:sulfite exporter TauE/SafE family protein [Shewanella metallivivens]MDD8060117.1 sulfite exporter TauE/SafE family protein [Shewanella metallivivens]
MLTDPIFWLVAIPAVLITGISKSGFAGGAGGLTVPLLALAISPAAAAAVMLPLLVYMDFLSVRSWWNKQSNQQLLILLPAAIVGIVVAYWLFDKLNEQYLRGILGGISLVFGIYGLTLGEWSQRKPSALIGRICGTLAGFTSFVAHAGGPPLNAYLIPLRLAKTQYLGTAVMFFAVVNLVKLIPYSMLGQINLGNLTVSAILAPIAWIGVKLGLRIQDKFNEKQFKQIILSLMILVGLRLLWTALMPS